MYPSMQLVGTPTRQTPPRQVPDNQSLPSTNEVWSKVIFLHLSVSHSVHGGGGGCIPACNWWAHRLGRHPQADTLLLQADTPGQTPPLADTPLADTPRRQLKWAVRVLLDCIAFLSFFVFAFLANCKVGTFERMAATFKNSIDPPQITSLSKLTDILICCHLQKCACKQILQL